MRGGGKEPHAGDSGGAQGAENRSVSRRRLLAAVTGTAVGSGALVGRAGAGRRSVADTGDRSPAGADPIREFAWVETPVDTDDSGRADRIHVEVARPQSTAEGERLPVIAKASPYWGEQTHGDTTEEMFYERSVAPVPSENAAERFGASGAVTAAGGATRPTATANPGRVTPPGEPIGPTPLEERWLPEGYVVAYVPALGTHESTGCYTAAAPPTLDAVASVVDWFNGRATAYDAPEGGETVDAHWTTGKTGMIGVSADGELANGAATTGVDGLAAIVPKLANASQYSLFRANGTPINVAPNTGDRMEDLGTWLQAGTAARDDCDAWVDRVEAGQDRETGNYNDFWRERSFLADADAVDAAVLIKAALDDPIVKPNQFADWYETLAARDVPVRLWLHPGEHIDIVGEAWDDLLGRWWAHWLKEEDRGVTREDPVTVVRGPDGAGDPSYDTYERWPVATERTTVGFGPGGGRPNGGDAEAIDPGESGEGTETFVDDTETPAPDHVAAEASNNRLRFETRPLAESVHLSGRVVPDLALSFSEPTVVSAALVEYADVGEPSIVTRGWADPLNRPAYGDYDSPLAYRESLRESEPLAADEEVGVEFPLQAIDHVFPEDARIGLVVYATDRAFTLHPPGDAEVTLSLADSSVDLPVVGGETRLAAALPAETTATPTPTDDGSSEGGLPGFGVGSALAALGTAAGLLHRRLSDDDREE